jgi:hypothetical protein
MTLLLPCLPCPSLPCSIALLLGCTCSLVACCDACQARSARRMCTMFDGAAAELTEHPSPCAAAGALPVLDRHHRAPRPPRASTIVPAVAEPRAAAQPSRRTQPPVRPPRESRPAGLAASSGATHKGLGPLHMLHSSPRPDVR